MYQTELYCFAQDDTVEYDHEIEETERQKKPVVSVTKEMTRPRFAESDDVFCSYDTSLVNFNLGV